MIYSYYIFRSAESTAKFTSQNNAEDTSRYMKRQKKNLGSDQKY